jgi:hypothetical protein
MPPGFICNRKEAKFTRHPRAGIPDNGWPVFLPATKKPI